MDNNDKGHVHRHGSGQDEDAKQLDKEMKYRANARQYFRMKWTNVLELLSFTRVLGDDETDICSSHQV